MSQDRISGQLWRGREEVWGHSVTRGKWPGREVLLSTPGFHLLTPLPSLCPVSHRTRRKYTPVSSWKCLVHSFHPQREKWLPKQLGIFYHLICGPRLIYGFGRLFLSQISTGCSNKCFSFASVWPTTYFAMLALWLMPRSRGLGSRP